MRQVAFASVSVDSGVVGLIQMDSNVSGKDVTRSLPTMQKYSTVVLWPFLV